METHRSFLRLAKVTCAIACLSSPALLLADSYSQINLVSDIPGLAATTDPNLKNPWGLSFSATSPFWVSNQGSGTSTLYNGVGTPTALIVTIPGSSTPPTGPTGQAFNSDTSSTAFNVDGKPASFIFDSKNGTIAAWNGSAGTVAVVTATTPGAIYTGLAQGTSGGATYLYAANSAGNIQVFDSSWNNLTASTFAGKFVDPSAISGYVPFNVQLIGSNLYVTYAQLGAKGIGLPGGYIDEYDTSGNFIARIATGGELYAPWGITLAPAAFGFYSNDLLVGNFGDGEILAYNPTTDAYLGTLDDSSGNPIVDSGLWALAARTGGAGVNPDALYFTAGIDAQADGLFGEIIETPEPSTIIETASGLIAMALLKLRRRNP